MYFRKTDYKQKGFKPSITYLHTEKKNIFNSNTLFLDIGAINCYQEVTILEILMVMSWKLSLKNLFCRDVCLRRILRSSTFISCLFLFLLSLIVLGDRFFQSRIFSTQREEIEYPISSIFRCHEVAVIIILNGNCLPCNLFSYHNRLQVVDYNNSEYLF